VWNSIAPMLDRPPLSIRVDMAADLKAKSRTDQTSRMCRFVANGNEWRRFATGQRTRRVTLSSMIAKLMVFKLIMITAGSKTWRRFLSPVPPDPGFPTIKAKAFD